MKAATNQSDPIAHPDVVEAVQRMQKGHAHKAEAAKNENLLK